MQGSPSLQAERGGKGIPACGKTTCRMAELRRACAGIMSQGGGPDHRGQRCGGRVAGEEAGIATCRQRPGWQVRKSSLKCSPSRGWGLGTEPPSPDSLVACSTGAVGSSGTEGPPPLVTGSELCPLPLPGLTLAPTTSGKHQICVKCAQGQTEVAGGRHSPKSE